MIRESGHRGTDVACVPLLGAGLAALLAGSPAGAQDLLYTFQGDADGDLAGFSVAGAGDVDADGYDDLVVGIMRDDDTGTDAGSARVLSGSASGISPGFPVDQVHLPLNIPNPDFNFTLRAANSASLPGSLGSLGFLGFLGFLDENGDATAVFVVPAGSNPNLAGTRVDHAFLAFDLAGNGVASLASNWVPLTSIP